MWIVGKINDIEPHKNEIKTMVMYIEESSQRQAGNGSVLHLLNIIVSYYKTQQWLSMLRSGFCS